MTTLAELRLANLREQKNPPRNPPPRRLPFPPPMSTKRPPMPRRRLPLRPAGRPGSVAIPHRCRAVPRAGTAIVDPEEEKHIRLIARVHSSLSHKVLHPTGAKATVDMSPALFHRAKRYCLDHGNVTLRQLFLDLMTAFLDEEGY